MSPIVPSTPRTVTGSTAVCVKAEAPHRTSMYRPEDEAQLQPGASGTRWLCGNACAPHPSGTLVARNGNDTGTQGSDPGVVPVVPVVVGAVAVAGVAVVAVGSVPPTVDGVGM